MGVTGDAAACEWEGNGGDGGIRTPDQGFADPCLNHLATSPHAWCRGGDLNPYALTGTAPSRRRVYLFHHLGSTDYLSDPAGSRASTRPDLAVGPQHSLYHRAGGWSGASAQAIKALSLTRSANDPVSASPPRIRSHNFALRSAITAHSSARVEPR